MMPFDAYKQYLSLKNHFTKDKYDYHKYCGKSRATVQSFYKRKDRFWFEKLARGKDDKEVIEFFISNFITCTDPSKLWIGEMILEGEGRYTAWKKRNQSLSYIFKEEVESILIENKIKILDLCPMNYGKTDLCKHEKSCTHNILKGFIKGFIKTYAFNTCLRLIKIIFQFSK